MVNSIFSLLLSYKIITPLLFKTDNNSRICSFRQINSFLKSKSLTIAIKCFLQFIHLLIKFTSLFMHASRIKSSSYSLKQLLRERDIVIEYNSRSLSWQIALQIQFNSLSVISFLFLQFSSLFLLVRFNKPLKISSFHLNHVLMLLFFCNLKTFIPLVQFLVHLHSFINFVVIK